MYSRVQIDDVEALVGADAEKRITVFLQDFRDEKLKLRRLLQPPMWQLAKRILFGGPMLFLVCMVIVLVLLLQGCTWKALTGDVDNAADFKDKARRADLEGDLLGDRPISDSVDPHYFARKSEKRD
jgi:hypothetical protein